MYLGSWLSEKSVVIPISELAANLVFWQGVGILQGNKQLEKLV